MVDSIGRLVAGFRGFHARYYEARPERMRELVANGQTPDVMIVACSDSRAEPALLLGTEPGEVFTVRNVANLVPPYEPDDLHHGTSAAIEYGVRDLGVGDIVVLGHSGCGGVRALTHARTEPEHAREFMATWMDIAGGSGAFNCEGHPISDQAAEQAVIQISLRNLMTFPWIAEAVRQGELRLHGWWVDLDSGLLCEIEPEGAVVRKLAGGNTHAVD